MRNLSMKKFAGMLLLTLGLMLALLTTVMMLAAGFRQAGAARAYMIFGFPAVSFILSGVICFRSEKPLGKCLLVIAAGLIAAFFAGAL